MLIDDKLVYLDRFCILILYVFFCLFVVVAIRPVGLVLFYVDFGVSCEVQCTIAGTLTRTNVWPCWVNICIHHARFSKFRSNLLPLGPTLEQRTSSIYSQKNLFLFLIRRYILLWCSLLLFPCPSYCTNTLSAKLFETQCYAFLLGQDSTAMN